MHRMILTTLVALFLTAIVLLLKLAWHPIRR
jgi:hypothetical protein